MLNHTLPAIENWLHQHAEQLAFSLRPAATEAEIEKLEALAGRSLPGDFKQLYSWHNGLSEGEDVGNLFYGLSFWPLSRVISTHQNRLTKAESIPLSQADNQLNSTNLFNRYWLQFCDDGSQTGLFLDVDPSSAGNYGQIIFLDPEFDTGLLVAPSTTELAQQFLSDLTAGLYTLNVEALEDETHFLEVDPTIDLVNWLQSERWKR